MSTTTLPRPRDDSPGLPWQLLRKLFFLEHGVDLLRPNALTWLLSMWLLVGAMAMVEAFAWGSVMLVVLDPRYAPVAVAIGVGWGLLLWLVDANFVTMDTRHGRRDRVLSGQSKDAAAGGWRSLWRSKLFLGALFRIAIVASSVLLAMPFLTRTLNERAEVQAIKANNDTAHSNLRAKIASEEDAKIEKLEGELAQQRELWVKETACKGVTKLCGNGPVAKAIYTNIQSLEVKLKQAHAAKAERLSTLARLSPEELARQEGLVLLADSSETRAKLRKSGIGEEDTILGLPASHVLASGLLLMLFCLMLVLKAFSPASVQTYLDDYAQEMYRVYRRGGFSDLPINVLRAMDRHDGPSPMDAWRFDSFLYEQYLPAQYALACDADEAAARERTKAAIQRVEQACDMAARRAAQIGAAMAEGIARKADFVVELAQLGCEIESKEHLIMDSESDIKKARLKDLAARRDKLEAQRRGVVDRHDVVVKSLKDYIPDRLEAAALEIERARRRLGCDAAVPTGASRDEGLLALTRVRDDILSDRTRLELERIALEASRQRLVADIAFLETDMARDVAIDDIVIPGGDDKIHALRERVADWRAEVTTLRARLGEAEEALPREQQHIDSLQQEHAQEQRAVDGFKAEIRSLEGALSRASLGSHG